MTSTNKVIINTAVLYGQLIIGTVISLLTTRIVLSALGEKDYGIYMLVAGVVGMLGILNSNMSNTSMRYMAHSLGTGDKEEVLKTFNTTVFLHLLIGVIVVIIMEVFGLLLFDYVLNIPIDKTFEVKVVYQFMVLSTFVTVISSPYDAVMNSHENMIALSLVDILGFVLKLCVAIYLSYIETNLLIIYGFSMLVIQVLQRVIKQWYSKVKYDECKIWFRKYVDKNLIKSIMIFTGWNLFGSIGAMSVIQIRGVLLNIFFGVKLNASEGIANSATNQINMVAVSMTRAINPQLIKSEGGGDRKRMLRIAEISTKFSVFLFGLFAIPIILEANYLLHIWLKNVPDYTVIFVQITLATLFIEKLTFSITDTLRAIGKIRNFQVFETTILVLTVPIAYLAFKLGYSPILIYLISMGATIINFGVRLYFGKIIAGININEYVKNAILPILFPIILAGTLATFVNLYMVESFVRLCLVTLIFMLIFTITFWYSSLLDAEKLKFKEIINLVFIRFKNKT